MRLIKLSLLAVLAAALIAVPALAADPPTTGGGESAPTLAKGPYKTHVHVQMAPGYRGPIHASDPIIVSIRGRGHGGERYGLCVTPAPLEHAACYTHRRVNGPGVSTAASRAGRLKLRWKLSTGKVVTRTLHIAQ